MTVSSELEFIDEGQGQGDPFTTYDLVQGLKLNTKLKIM